MTAHAWVLVDRTLDYDSIHECRRCGQLHVATPESGSVPLTERCPKVVPQDTHHER